MSRQAVMASVMGATLNVGKQSTGYIDASSIAATNLASSTLGNFRVFLKGTAGTPYNFPNSVAAGAPLIDAIQEISSSATKVTKIDMKFEAITVAQSMGNISIWIDWESLRVKWSGMYRGAYTVSQGSNARGIIFGVYQGDEAISAVSNSTVQMRNTDFQDDQRGGPTLTLEVDANRNIVKLPLFYSGATRNTTTSGLNAVSYAITTDTGVIVTATSTPPAETPTVEVAGIKISELNGVDTLQDDDLFVLSQDNPSNGTYDASYNVTLAKLGKSIGITAGYNTGFLDTHGGVAVENGATLTITHNLNTKDLLVKIFAAKDTDGTGNMEVQWQTGNLSLADGYGAQVTGMEPNYITLQLGATGLLFLNSSGNDAAPGDTGGRSYSVGGLGGRWNFIKVLCVQVS